MRRARLLGHRVAPLGLVPAGRPGGGDRVQRAFDAKDAEAVRVWVAGWKTGGDVVGLVARLVLEEASGKAAEWTVDRAKKEIFVQVAEKLLIRDDFAEMKAVIEAHVADPVLVANHAFDGFLAAAITYMDVELLSTLIAAGADPNAATSGEEAPIVVAAQTDDESHRTMITLLLKAGADRRSLLAARHVAPRIRSEVRKELLGPAVPAFAAGLKRTVAVPLAAKLVPVDLATKPAALLEAFRRLADAKRTILIEGIEAAVGESERAVAKRDLERQERASSSAVESSESQRLKFLGHLLNAKGTLKKRVDLEGFTATASLMHYAAGLQQAAGAAKGGAAEALLEQIGILARAFEHAVELHLIEGLLGDFEGTETEVLETMAASVAKDLEAERGALFPGGYRAPEGEESGHAVYVTTPGRHARLGEGARVHNLGGGSEVHPPRAGGPALPYVVASSQLGAPVDWVVRVLTASLRRDRRLAEKTLYSCPKMSAKAVEPAFSRQRRQAAGNCAVANLENAVLAMLQERLGKKAGKALLAEARPRIEQLAASLLEGSTLLAEVLGHKHEASLVKAVKEKDGQRIVDLVADGGKVSKQSLADRAFWIGLATMAKSGTAAKAFAALRKAVTAKRSDAEAALATLHKKTIPEPIQQALDALFPG